MVEGTRVGTGYLELVTELGKLESGLARAKQMAKAAGDDMASEAERAGSRMGTGFSKVGHEFEDLGKKAAIGIGAVGAGVTTVSVLAGKAAIDFESAFAGVRKTVDGTEAEFAKLRQGIRDLAKEVPVSPNTLAAIAEMGGQLGIAKGNLLDFTRVMAMMGDTTNLTAEQAAEAFAQISNITQEPQANIERMASTVVSLGNAGASTEQDIVAMALRIAGAGKTVGMTTPQILGLAAALADVGIEAEAGGSSISRVMVDMAQAVAEGGEKLQTFAGVAGMSASQFAQAFRDDPTAAIIAFVGGLGRIQEAGGNVFGVLEDLEFGEVRVRDALLRLMNAQDRLPGSIANANQAWEENTALAEEAGKRYETTASQMQIARNNLNDLLITLGDMLLPVISEFVAKVSTGAEALNQFVQRVQEVGLAAALIERGFSPELVAMIMAVVDALRATGGAIGEVLGHLSALTANSDMQVAAFGALLGIIGLLAIATAAWAVSMIAAAAPVLALVAAAALLGAGIAYLVLHFDDGSAALGRFVDAARGGAAAEAMDALVSRFKDAGATVWDFVVKVASIPEVQRAALLALGPIPAALILIATHAAQTADAVNAFGSTLADAIDDVVDFVEAVERAPSQIDDLGAALYDVGRDAVDGLGEGMSDAAQDVLDWAAGIPDDILDAIGDLSGLLFDAGGDLIGGLWDGAKDKAGDFAGWLTSRPGAWLDAIKYAADGNSPWGIMVPAGVDLVAGIQQGVDEQAPFLLSQLDALVSAAAARVSAIVNGMRAAQAAVSNGALPGAIVTPAGWTPGNPWAATGPDNPYDFGLEVTQSEAAAWYREHPDFVGPLPPDSYEDLARSIIEQSQSGRAYSGGSYSGGGGGGGRAAAVEATVSALDAFLEEVAANINHDALVKEFGEVGARGLEAFAAAMAEGAGDREGRALADAIDDIIEEAREDGVENWEVLGADLIAAVSRALTEGTPEAIEAARVAFAAITSAAAAEAELTVETFTKAFGDAAASRQTQDRLGSAGTSFMAAFRKAVDEGGAKNIDALGKQADSLVTRLKEKLPPDQALYIGAGFMGALTRAIEEKSPEAIAALDEMLEDINTVLDGGAVEITSGLIYTAEQIDAFAKKLGVSAQAVVDNITLLSETGLLGMLDLLKQVPEEVQRIIKRILDDLAKGIIDAQTARDAIINTLNGIGGVSVDPATGAATYIPPTPGTTGSIAEGLTELLGFNPFDPRAGSVSIGGRTLTAADLIHEYISRGPVGFGRALIYGGIEATAAPYSPAMDLTKPPKVGDVSVDGMVWLPVAGSSPTTYAWQFPGRAFGGPVLSDIPYLVGELGPELFIPDSPGSILSNRDLLGMLDGRGGGDAYSFNPMIVIQGNADERVLRTALNRWWEETKEHEFGVGAAQWGAV